MTAPERKQIDDLVEDGIAALQTLYTLWLQEDADAQWSTRTDMPAVTSSGKSDPTGTVAGLEKRETTRDKIGNSIATQVEHLMKAADRFQPKQTGNCITEGCIREGISSFGGRCEKCGPWMLNNRHMTDEHGNPMTPDKVANVKRDDRGVEVSRRSLVDDWNESAPRFCECPNWCCPERCDRSQEHGRLSEACKRAMTRSDREPPYGRREAS